MLLLSLGRLHVSGLTRLVIGAVFAALVAGSLAVIRAPAGWTKKSDSWVAGWLRDLLEDWREIMRDRATFLFLCGLSLVQLLIIGGGFLVCFLGLRMNAGFFAAVMFSAVGSLTTRVNVTSAAVGTGGVLVALLAAQFGLDFAHGMLAASIDRVAMIFFAVPAGALA